MSQSTLAPEFAPSDTRSAAPTLARLVGLVGLFLTVIGSTAVIANQFTTPWIGEGWGYLWAALGVALLLFHAARDADVEIRRVYGGLGVALLVAAVVVSFYPAKLGGAASRTAGGLFLPYGATCWLGGLLFLIPFTRHETDLFLAAVVRNGLLAVGAALGLWAVVAGVIQPETLVGPGVVLALLGLLYVAAFLGQVDTSDGPGYWAACGLGVLGAVAAVVAVGLSVVPTVLHEGPKALRGPAQELDTWRVIGRVAVILLGLAVAYWGWKGRVAVWLRAAIVVLGLAFAGVFVLGTFAAPLITAPKTYLVPYGLLLLGIGVTYVAVSVATVSDDQFVTLTRRELAAYFFSPIAYAVLIGQTLVAAVGYLFFVSEATRPMTEPIVQGYWGATMGAAFGVLFLVPAITMRAFSEEKRTGTLEVLLTAPVTETAVVLSKFLAGWLFFMLCWAPVGLFLIAFRMENGPFDYKPLLAYYLAMGACGLGFVAMGLFFSSLTVNQIVAAVLTFAGMFGLLLTILIRRSDFLAPALQAAVAKLDFFSLWQQALGGQLPVQPVLVQASLAVFWLFLTIKVLEVRKWS